MYGNHRTGLRIEIGDLPEKFYNERKKAAMELQVKLVNERNEIVRDRYVPLKALLLYEGGKEVYDQKILHSKNIRMAIDRSGQAILQFRIEDVSKNHQKQQFVIQLTPDLTTHPENADIHGGATTPVCAMSKNPDDRSGMKKGSLKRRKDYSSDDDSDDESDCRSTKSPRYPALDSGILAPTLPPTTRDISSLINPLCDQQSTAELIVRVMEEYRATVVELEQLRWKVKGESDSGEKFYKMSNPNSTIEGLIKRYDIANSSMRQHIREVTSYKMASAMRPPFLRTVTVDKFEPKPEALKGGNLTDPVSLLPTTDSSTGSLLSVTSKIDAYHERVFPPRTSNTGLMAEINPPPGGFNLPSFSSVPGQGKSLPSLTEGTDLSQLESLVLQGLMSLPSSSK